MSKAWTFGTAGIYLPVFGRVLLGLIFVINGVIKFSGLAGTAEYIALYGLPMPMVLAVLAGVLELAAGVMLIVGFHARIAAMLLAGYVLLVTAIFHNQVRDPLQSTMALKNLAIAGGLLYATRFGPGAMSLRQSGCGCCEDHACSACGAKGTCGACGDQGKHTSAPMGA